MKQSFLILEEIEKHNLWKIQVTLKRNEYLKVAGSIDTNAYYILSGSMRIFVIDMNDVNKK